MLILIIWIVAYSIAETPVDIKVHFAVVLQSGVTVLTQGLLMMPFLQLLAFYKSLGKGLNPDRPKNLETVVRL